ncbi:MAG: hypothetical protein AAGA60_02210 [Cyanobacteria bacterium P01_E01_bin.42]
MQLEQGKFWVGLWRCIAASNYTKRSPLPNTTKRARQYAKKNGQDARSTRTIEICRYG